MVAAVLQQIGVSIWYWGYRMPYMQEYTTYGAREFGRQEFNSLLRQNIGVQLLPLSTINLPSMISLDVQVASWSSTRLAAPNGGFQGGRDAQRDEMQLAD